MKNSIKFTYLSFVYILLSMTHEAAFAQTDNKPDNSTISTAPVIYPGIHDLNSDGKFNYVRTIIPDEPVQSISGSTFYRRQSTVYFDGLGRPLQTVIRKGHADGNDIVDVHVYDSLGRETYQYLPYAAPTGGLYVFGYGPGVMKIKDSTQMRGFYEALGNDEQPYSKTVFENSPLQRVVKQMMPGKSWVGQERGIKFDYKSNRYWAYTFGMFAKSIGNAYPRFSIGPNADDVPIYEGNYGDGQLFITIATDEDGKSIWEVKDKAGLIVTRMQQITNATSNFHPTDFAFTFYVYDDLGRLRCIMPPEVVKPHRNPDGWSIYWDFADASKLDGLCYSYVYDKRNRLIEKKMPGKLPEYYVYDQRDRQVFYQDGNLRTGNTTSWLATIYDALDRPICTYIYASGAQSREYLQGLLDDNSVYGTLDGLYYMKDYSLLNTYPSQISNGKILTYTYYDNYSQGDIGTMPYDPDQFFGIQLNNRIVPPSNQPLQLTRGLPTGCKVRVIDPADPDADNWLKSVNYYDDKGRLVQSQNENLKGTKDITSNVYYFQGSLFKNISSHSNPADVVIDGADDDPIVNYRLENTFERNFGIDGGNDQVWLHKQKINGGVDYHVSAYGYDHLGRTVLKQYTAGLNFQDYNMRGLLSDIFMNDYHQDTLFQERLYYDFGFHSKLYNGNIAGIIWSGSDQQKRAYGYTYDMMNRLGHAEFRYLTNPGSPNPDWDNNNIDYTVSNITYDLNGNLKSMDQMVKAPATAPFPMDQLTYTYEDNSNRLKTVEDAVPNYQTEQYGLPDFQEHDHNSQEYHYDDNGNLIQDDNKDITSITYNHLNKPEIITFGSNKTITYIYDAIGNLLQKKVVSVDDGIDETWDYIENFVYKNNQLQYIIGDEGRARPVAASGDLVPANSETSHPTIFVYDYFIKDHLGNVRSTITATPATYQYAATHDLAFANTEELVFDNIPIVRDFKPGSVSLDDKYAARLNPSDGKAVGTAIMLQVRAGDKLHFSVNSFYSGEFSKGDAIGTEALITSLSSALLGGQNLAGVPIRELPENAQIINGILQNPELATELDAVINSNDNPNAPKAHLNFLLFDDDLNLKADKSGSIQVFENVNGISNWNTLGDGTLVNPGTSSGTTVTNWQAGDFQAATTGFLLVYIDNQSIGQDVWFDNLVVNHYESTVLEEDHYYPYGLALNITPMQNGINSQPYMHNTKELEINFGLQQYDYGARKLDPQIGLWHVPDALAEICGSESPYCFGGNNPSNNVDIGGFLKTRCDVGALVSQGVTMKEIKTFQTIVQNIGNLIINNPNVLQEMVKITGLSESQIKSDFIGGNGPFVDLIAKGFTESVGGTITIDGRFIKYLCSLDPIKDRDAYNQQLFGVALAILHEYAHYGDQKTNGWKNSGQFTYYENVHMDGSGSIWSVEPYTKYFGTSKNVDVGVQPYKISITGHRGDDIEAVGFGVISEGEYSNPDKITFRNFLNYLPYMKPASAPALPIVRPENSKGDNIRSTLGLP